MGHRSVDANDGLRVFKKKAVADLEAVKWQHRKTVSLIG
jgi:hypothetical protein